MQVFGQLKQELDVHTQVEEEFFYPALQNSHPSLIQHAENEHAMTKTLLQDLDASQKVCHNSLKCCYEFNPYDSKHLCYRTDILVH